MPTVTLIKPARLNSKGRLWERNVPVHVNAGTAQSLRGDPRFKVEGIPGVTEPDGNRNRPTNRVSLFNQITNAIGKLAPDDEYAWLSDGFPNPYAISHLVGYEVSMADIRQATNTPDETAAETAAEAEGEAKTQARKPRPPLKTSRKAKAGQDPAPVDTAEGITTEDEPAPEEPAVTV
ncbi:MAG: hypothetical protein LC676_16740 [Loktanella sp.]|nr:hypothetical protein [Loktanella sp.]